MKKSNLILVIIMALAFFSLTVMTWTKAKTDYSDSERRALASFPELSEKTVTSGKFMKDFETYTLDQFPMRDIFRRIKALAQFGLFQHKDNNDIYLAEGYVSKLEYPLNEYMLENAGKKFQYLYDTYMADKDVNVYFAIVPDKNYFLAEKNGYLSMDYGYFYDTIYELTPFMKQIEIRDLLTIEDYYKTDTHWKQECILDVADQIAASMGNELQWEYESITAEQPFYGVYYGQSALTLKPDTLTYLTNDNLEMCTVTSYDTGLPKEKELYDLAELDGRDPYEMFLAGSDALLVVENPNATTEKELVVFRDSFASSLLPLLIESYTKVTVIDIRYVQSNILGNFVEFGNQDVLFLYSTLVLNTSTSFK